MDKEKTKEEEKELLSKAVNWVADKHSDGKKCPICDAGFMAPNALKSHLRGAHPYRVIAWHAEPEKGADAVVNNPPPEDAYSDIGIGVGEDYNEPNRLHIPNAIERKINERGDYARWINERADGNVQRRLDAGFKFAEAQTPEQKGSYSENTGDSKVRAGDLVLMYQPRELREKRNREQARKTHELQGSILSRGEERGSQLKDVGKATYEAFKANGMSPQNAMVLANRADREGRVIRPRGPGAVQHHR